MLFTKQDLLTFVLGLVAALIIEVKPILEAIADADNPFAAIDMRIMGSTLFVAALRYLTTRIPELIVKLRAK